MNVARTYQVVSTKAALVLSEMIPSKLLADGRGEYELDFTVAEKTTLRKWQAELA